MCIYEKHADCGGGCSFPLALGPFPRYNNYITHAADVHCNIIERVARSSTAVRVQWEWLLSPLSESQSGARLVSVVRISEAKGVRFSEVSNVLALR